MREISPQFIHHVGKWLGFVGKFETEKHKIKLRTASYSGSSRPIQCNLKNANCRNSGGLRKGGGPVQIK